VVFEAKSNHVYTRPHRHNTETVPQHSEHTANVKTEAD